MESKMPQKEFDDFIFSRLYAKTHFVVLESNYMHVMEDLKEYCTSKGLETTDGKFSIFITKDCPTLSLVDKTIVPKEMIAQYLETVLNDKEKAAILRRSNTHQDIIALIDISDLLSPLVIYGMDAAYRKWVKEFKGANGSKKE